MRSAIFLVYFSRVVYPNFKHNRCRIYSKQRGPTRILRQTNNKRVCSQATTQHLNANMVLGKKAYPKATIKKVIKAHSGHNLKKNVDVTVRPRANWSCRVPGLTIADIPRICSLHGNVNAEIIHNMQYAVLTHRQTHQRSRYRV